MEYEDNSQSLTSQGSQPYASSGSSSPYLVSSPGEDQWPRLP
jgi:hypothetical protein